MDARVDKLPQHERPTKKTSPTARSLKYLREAGHSACVVEKWIPYLRRRVDAFGFGDILVAELGKTGALLVQTTTQDNAAARVAKIAKECGPAARCWLAAGNRIEVHGWAKRGGRGDRKLWSVSVRSLTLADLP